MVDSVNISQESAERIASEIARALGNNRPAPSGPGSTSAPGGGSLPTLGASGNNFVEFINNASAGLGKLASGSATAADSMGLISKAVSAIPGFGEELGALTSGITKLGSDATKTSNDLSKYGANLGGNLGELTKGVTGARMSMEDYQNIIKGNSTALNGLASNTDDSSRTFLHMAKMMQERPIADTLMRAGIGMDEFNKLLSEQANIRKNLDYTDAKNRKGVIESTLQLANEFDNLAKLTGVSREQQAKDLEQQTAKVQVQAMMMQMDEQQQSQFVDTMATMGKYGETVQNVTEELYSGGIRSKEGAQAFTALGGAGKYLQEAIMLERQGRPEDKARIAELKLQFDKAMHEQQTDKSRLNQLMLYRGNDPTMQAQQKLFTEYNKRAMGPEQQLRFEALQQKKTVDELRAEKEQARDMAKQGKTPTGEEDVNLTASRTMNAVEGMTRDAAAVAGEGFEKLNTATGGLIKEFQDATGVVQRFSQEGGSKKVEDMFDKMKKAAEPYWKGTETTAVPSGSKPGAAPIPSRANGSIDTVNKWFEQWGVGKLAMLHGEEGIVTKDQFKMMGTEFNNVLKQAGVTGFNPATQQITSAAQAQNLVKQLTSQGAPNLASGQLDKTLKSLGVTGFGKSTTPATQPKAPSKPKGLFDSMSDMFFGIGDAAGKGYDNLFGPTKKKTPSISSLGAGADAAALKAKHDDPLGKIPGLGGDVRQLQKAIMSDQARAEEKKRQAEIKAAIEPGNLKQPAEPAKPTETEAPKEAPATMNDVKEELVKLNISIKELISHTDNVAQNVNRQTKATKGLSGNRAS